MTTILAVQGDGWAVIGSDSQWSTEGGRIGKSSQPKVITLGKYLIGIAGHTRGANIIQHSFTPPPIVSRWRLSPWCRWPLLSGLPTYRTYLQQLCS